MTTPTPGRLVAGTFACALATGLVGLGDYGTGIYLSVSPLYLLPVAAAAWWLGAWPAALTVALATLAWYAAEYGWDYEYPPLVSTWNAAARAVVFGTVAALIVGLRRRSAELAQAKEALQEALCHEAETARVDTLTGLRNRRAFLERLHAAVGPGRSALTVAYLDVDDFKLVNDRHGHDAGDQLLADLGHALSQLVREHDVAARLGGDEFAVLFVSTPAEMAQAALERLVQAADQVDTGRAPVPAVSIGIVHFPEGAQSAEVVLAAADRAMYAAKRAGKGRVVTMAGAAA